MSKPTLPKGTRDFGTQEMLNRNYLFNTIRKHFHRMGFMQIETPAMETLATLTGKYGDEGDQLIFKVLNSGDYLKDTPQDLLNEKNSKKALTHISEKALRYDLTVPTARYVVMNQHNISFPFKRYQIQPVWRADRPQKGRYREFYQCDADIIGSNSLLNEVELISLFDNVFFDLDLCATVQLNNRKILTGIAQISNAEANIIDITVAIDKLDKIGKDGVLKELADKNISPESINAITPLLDFTGTTADKLAFLKNYLAHSDIGKKGIEEIEFILNHITTLGLKKCTLELDITLARGLNYYTGAIMEVKVNDPRTNFTSSICGGGRYDDLTGVFGLKGMSGVGVSFGADRIYDVLLELNLFPTTNPESTRILFANYGATEALHCLQLIAQLRANGINAELYPDAVKMGKQLKYADDKNIPYAAMIGSDEITQGIVKIKNLATAEQQTLTTEQLIDFLKL
jgi:histidyl-tRNA synthetase